jgi:hypothetical protein
MTKQTATAALIWTAVLGTSAIFGSYFFACVFPFAAMATIAALTLDVRRGVALVVATWFANQIVGFTLMHYPQTLDTVALGVSLGLGALAAYAVAHLVLRSVTSPVRTVAALAGAFVAYQLVIYAGALGFGGADNFSADIIGGVALNDAIWFVGLYALHFALTRAAPTLLGGQVARSA